jgi:cytochrome b561
MRLTLPAFALIAAATPALAVPTAWTVVPASSSISFSGTQSGAPFTGKFGQWTAQIAFDPADLPHSSARVVIATATGKTGDGMKDASLGQDEWFDTAHFPRATFATTKISAAGPGRYVADGVLTIKGKAVPVKLPFTLKIAGNVATMNGTVTVDRLAFGMGAKSDPSGQWVSKQIGLTIAVTAKK